MFKNFFCSKNCDFLQLNAWLNYDVSYINIFTKVYNGTVANIRGLFL